MDRSIHKCNNKKYFVFTAIRIYTEFIIEYSLLLKTTKNPTKSDEVHILN